MKAQKPSPHLIGLHQFVVLVDIDNNYYHHLFHISYSSFRTYFSFVFFHFYRDYYYPHFAPFHDHISGNLEFQNGISCQIQICRGAASFIIKSFLSIFKIVSTIRDCISGIETLYEERLNDWTNGRSKRASRFSVLNSWKAFYFIYVLSWHVDILIYRIAQNQCAQIAWIITILVQRGQTAID